MKPALKLLRPEQPSQQATSRPFFVGWVAVLAVVAGALSILAVMANIVTADARRAASECRRAADELKQERETFERVTANRTAIERESERQAAVIAVLQERLKEKK